MSIYVFTNGNTNGPLSPKEFMAQIQSRQVDEKSLVGPSPNGPFSPIAILFANLDAKRFHVQNDGGRAEYLSVREVEQKVGSGELDGNTRISRDGSSWGALGSIGVVAGAGAAVGVVSKTLLDHFGIGAEASPQYVVENASLFSAEFGELAGSIGALAGVGGGMLDLLSDLF